MKGGRLRRVPPPFGSELDAVATPDRSGLDAALHRVRQQARLLRYAVEAAGMQPRGGETPLRSGRGRYRMCWASTRIS